MRISDPPRTTCWLIVKQLACANHELKWTFNSVFSARMTLKWRKLQLTIRYWARIYVIPVNPFSCFLSCRAVQDGIYTCFLYNILNKTVKYFVLCLFADTRISVRIQPIFSVRSSFLNIFSLFMFIRTVCLKIKHGTRYWSFVQLINIFNIIKKTNCKRIFLSKRDKLFKSWNHKCYALLSANLFSV